MAATKKARKRKQAIHRTLGSFDLGSTSWFDVNPNDPQARIAKALERIAALLGVLTDIKRHKR